MSDFETRRVMSAAEFDAIPEDGEDLIVECYDILIDRNERIDSERYGRPEGFREGSTSR